MSALMSAQLGALTKLDTPGVSADVALISLCANAATKEIKVFAEPCEKFIAVVLTPSAQKYIILDPERRNKFQG
jgi:hypothetical protein